MAKEKTSIEKGIEELLRTSMEMNKLWITEGSKIFQQFGSNNNATNFSNLKTDKLSDAFAAYTQLNIQYMKNVVALGLSFTRDVMGNTNTQGEEETEPDETATKPAFTLRATGKPGSTISVQFRIDNVKETPADCKLVNTSFIQEENPGISKDFETVFEPQSFTLDVGASIAITIVTIIPIATEPGTYTSHAQVLGFEPAFFSISLTITE